MLKRLLIPVFLFATIPAMQANPNIEMAEAARAPEQPIQTFELPRDSVALRRELISLINLAQSEILVAMYILTDQEIIDTLIEAARRGVNLQIIVDENTPKLDDLIGKFLGKEIIPLIFPSKNPAVKALMHHKFLVIDNQKVWTGSANFSAVAIGASARGHYENIVVIDSSYAAQNYTRIFYAEKREIFSLYINLLSNNARENLKWFILRLSQLHYKGLGEPYSKEEPYSKGSSQDFRFILKEEWIVAKPYQRDRFRKLFPWFDESKLPPQEEREESQSPTSSELFSCNESPPSQQQE